MKLMNININKYFHMIPLWKSPSKLPLELPYKATVCCAHHQVWTAAKVEPAAKDEPVAKLQKLDPLQNLDPLPRFQRACMWAKTNTI